MTYREYRPCAALQPYVSCYWTRAGIPNAQPHTVLPDGCIDILFRVGESAVLESSIIGTMTEALVVPGGESGSDFAAVRFLPGGAYPFLKIPAHEFTDQAIELKHAFGREVREIEDKLIERRSPLQRVALLERLLLDRLPRGHDQDHDMIRLGHEIWLRPHELSVKELSSQIGISERQLERKFSRHAGIGPKALLRILRFQQVLKSAQAAVRPDWAGLAVDCGYFDQAHLIRDFRRYTGLSPKKYHVGFIQS